MSDRASDQRFDSLFDKENAMLEVHFVGEFSQEVFEQAIPKELQIETKQSILHAVCRLQRDILVFHRKIDTIGTTVVVGDGTYRVILSRTEQNLV